MKPEGHGSTCFCSECREAEGGDLPQSVDDLIKEVKDKIRDITYYVKENAEMLPTEGDSRPRGQQQRTGRKRYLKDEDLTTTPKEFTLTDLRYDAEGKFGPKVELKLVGDGHTYFWGVSVKKNPNYNLLLERFGRDENNWVQQKILLNLQEDKFDNQYYIHVSFPSGTETTGTRGTETAGTRARGRASNRGE